MAATISRAREVVGMQSDVTCHWWGCEEQATHIVNWTTERRREWLCDEHTERQRQDFASEIRVKPRQGTAGGGAGGE